MSAIVTSNSYVSGELRAIYIRIFSEERVCAAVLKVNLIDSAAICSEASEKDGLMSSFKGNHNKIAMHHFFGTPCSKFTQTLRQVEM